MKRAPFVLAVAVGLIVVSLIIFLTFIEGRTGGPDFIEAIMDGKVAANEIESIDVFAPQTGSMPFRESEYSQLQRIAQIDSPTTIKGIVSSLAKSEHQFPDMNHPVVTNVCYLRVNTKKTWYWIYCDLLDDGRYRGLAVQANTARARNPNGASRYFLEATEDILAASRKKN